MQNILFQFIEQYMPLSEEEKHSLISLDIFRSEKKGTVLLKEGERSTNGYFILKGCIRSYYCVEGEEKTTAFYTEMEGITPPSITTGEPSDYYIACVEDTLFTVASPDMEVSIFEQFPRFETLCRIISEELLARQQIDFDRFKISSPEQRYIDLANRRPDLIQRVPQHQLASFIGITPQSLSRLKSRILKNSD